MIQQDIDVCRAATLPRHKGWTVNRDSHEAPLLRRLPAPGTPIDHGALLDGFLDYVKDRGVELYQAQEEAILALFDGGNVILNTPTGSGKSLVATALHFHSLATGRRSFYTCPIKALVNEKFLALCNEFGADQVGMITGDASVNSKAPIICCTAEILANMALREGEKAPVDDVIMDEFHYYSDRERGVAWQLPLLTMPNARFLLMSATMGDTTFFEKGLKELTGRDTIVVRSNDRPVPLTFVYQETLLHETIKSLLSSGKAPIYLVNFTQRDCAEEAQKLMSVDFATKEEKAAIAAVLSGVKFSSPYGKEIQRLLKHGIGLHHAGLLPKYRLLVEQLAQKGLLKVISGTDTLGVGVNVPIRTVLFTKLCKFDGSKATILSVRDFQQISGRAGRKGFDDHGTVVVQAPEHVVENMSMESKAAGDPKKLKKIVKKKPPERGYVHWDVNTFNRLISSPPEPLTSSFQVSHGMLLNILSRDGDGCRAMKKLIRECHETPQSKKTLTKTAFQMFRSLVERGIIRFEWLAEYRHKKILVDSNLQTDFSLNQSLALYLLDTIKLLDPYSPDFALDLLTLVESILENPELILRKQLDRIKSRKMAEMKADGIEYEERMAELEKLEYPKPNRDFIYETFNRFAATHPWVGNENIRPKSIAREMYESFFSFEEYIRDYEQQRAEGLLLRYLMEVYKVLVQTVPESYRNEEIEAMIDYFGRMIRSIDSSLLDEWEKLRNPTLLLETEVEQAAHEAPDITRDMRAFTVQIRNEVFRFVRTLAAGDAEGALALIEGGTWTIPLLSSAVNPYFDEHEAIVTDRQARHPQHCRVKPQKDPEGWRVEQTLIDPAEHNDWQVSFFIDRQKSREQNRPVLELLKIGHMEDI
jgi:superfamily II RNA helicase